MNFLSKADVTISLHTALRKGCDSNASSAAWNLVYLLKPDEWAMVGDEVITALKDYTPPPVPVRKDTDWDLMHRITLEMTPLIRTHLLRRWKPYGKGHGIVALFCILELFSDADWVGFVSFLPFLIPPPPAKDKAVRKRKAA